MKKMTLLAPCKVNLVLKIKRRRPDGYHDIETLFEKIGIFDKITLKEIGAGIKIKSRSGNIPLDDNNICYKAAKLVIGRFGIKKGVEITIQKKIPVFAGLGGGSSDGASVILGLNKMWKLRMTENEMVKLAGKVGSDAAFFIINSPFAIGKGRGELLRKVNLRLDLWHLVVTPDIKLSTANIYKIYSKKHQLALTTGNHTGKILHPRPRFDNMGRLEAFLQNDLEDVVLKLKPITNRIKKSLLAFGAKASMLSGSGSSVFGIFDSKKEALKAKRMIWRTLPVTSGWQAFVAKTYTRGKEIENGNYRG